MDPKSLSLLLIEDDSNDSLIIKYFLEEKPSESPFELVCADTLKEGCRLLAERPFDVVILDLHLPDSSGIDSVRKVRGQKPEVPVIVLTGLKDEAVALNALNRGAQDYLVKGMINGYFLKRAISHAIERSKLTAQFENILTQDPDGKVLVDEKGVICYANPAAESLLGRRAGGLLGKLFTYPLPVDGPAEVRSGGPGAEERIVEVRSTRIDWRGASVSLASLRNITQAEHPRHRGDRGHGHSAPARARKRRRDDADAKLSLERR